MDIKPGQKWVMHGMHENELTILGIEDQEVKYAMGTRPDEDTQICSIDELTDWGVLSYEPPTMYDDLELMLDE